MSRTKNNKNIDCSQHGEQLPAFVCKHLLETLYDNTPRGLVWTSDADGDISAYCSNCENMLISGGGEWNDDLSKDAGVSLICVKCFEQIQIINNDVGTY